MSECCIIKTPFCDLEILCQQGNIVSVDFITGKSDTVRIGSAVLQKMKQQVLAYCRTPRNSFELPLAPKGTDFQHKVWAELRQIPSGQVKTYGEIARKLGTSPRAVGNACRKNPIPFIVPCHRVIAQNGLGGFAGATKGEYLKIKMHLLRHEGVEIG